MIGVVGSTWQDRAHCLGQSHLFYSDDENGRQRYRRGYQDAARLCADCPVIRECFNYVASFEMESSIFVHGFWAGMNEAQRMKAYDAIRKRRRERVGPR